MKTHWKKNRSNLLGDRFIQILTLKSLLDIYFMLHS
jgi:hypothetical protein